MRCMPIVTGFKLDLLKTGTGRDCISHMLVATASCTTVKVVIGTIG